MHPATESPRTFESFSPSFKKLLGVHDRSKLLRRELATGSRPFFLHFRHVYILKENYKFDKLFSFIFGNARNEG